MRLVVASLLALAGCAHAAAPPKITVNEPKILAPAVDIRVTGKHPRKPPLITLYADVTLRNTEKTARWFVIPDRIPVNPEDAKGGVMGVEAYETTTGEGRAVVAKLVGMAGAQAVLVPAGGEVKLTKLALSGWQPLKASVPIEVVIASSITVGGEPITAWLGENRPESDARVSADGASLEPLGSKMTEDHGEVPVKYEEVQRVALDLRIP